MKADDRKVLDRIDASLGGIASDQRTLAEGITRLEEHAHRPIECPAMGKHEESHGRHVRWFFWGLGAIVGIIGMVVGVAKAF